MISSQTQVMLESQSLLKLCKKKGKVIAPDISVNDFNPFVFTGFSQFSKQAYFSYGW